MGSSMFDEFGERHHKMTAAERMGTVIGMILGALIGLIVIAAAAAALTWIVLEWY